MIRAALSTLLLLAVLVSAAVGGRANVASAEIDVRTDVASNLFPDGLRFRLFFASDDGVSDVRLRFSILPGGIQASVRPECSAGDITNCEAIVGSTRDSYMVPGAEVVYSWEVTDEAGEVFTTDEQTVVYADERFQWESMTEGNITVNYYFGDEESQRNVLSVAQETVDDFSDLLNTTIEFPIKVWVYQTAADMQPAVASRFTRGDNDSVQTLGEVGAADTALVSRDTDFLNIVRHELAHVVTGAATEHHLVDIPIWINEGLSTFAQSELLPSEATALQIAIDRNAVLPITSLGASARGTGSVVSLFYAQSGSIVSYLIETYGREQFGEFITALEDDTPDAALMEVYGFDQIGLENEWRTSVGLPEFDPNAQQQLPEPTPESAGQAPSQQEPPPQEDEDPPAQTSSDGDDDGGGISLILIAAVLGIFVVLLLVAAAGIQLRSSRGPGS